MRQALRWMGMSGLVVALLGGVGTAHAMDLQVQAGRSMMGSGDAWTNVAFVELVDEPHPLGDWDWAPDATVGWIQGRSTARYDLDRPTTRDTVWVGALGARVHYGSSDDWYHHIFFSFQPALQSGRTQALSSSYEFVSTLGWEEEHWNVQLRHISNGGFQEPNRGETMLLVGVNFSL